MNSNKFSYFTSGSFKKDVYSKCKAFKAYNISLKMKVSQSKNVEQQTYPNKQHHLENLYVEYDEEVYYYSSDSDDDYYH